MRIPRTVLLLWLVSSGQSCLADEPRPAISLRIDRPDQQVRAVIDLFRGSRAAHPPAALAAWKRASREPDRLGKPLEGLIAAFNPAMSDEIRTLDGAELSLWFDPRSGQLTWGAFLPEDDGSFAALATALVLSGGAAEDPRDGLAIDRLGPPGSALMARGPHALLVASSLDGLKEARIRSSGPRVRDLHEPLRFVVDPLALEGSKSLLTRRFNAVLREARGSIIGTAGLDRSKLKFKASITLGGDPPGQRAVLDSEWLDWIPADRAMAGFAVAIDPSPANWDVAFRLADRVEKVDPARQNVAPVRLRLDLLARTLGLRTDGELLPHLKGLTGWIGADGRAVDRAFLMLQLDDEAVARRIFERVKPLTNTGPPPAAEAGAGRLLGQVEGRALRLFRSGTAVVATWGDGVMDASLDARTQPDRSARQVFHDLPGDPKPAFVGAVWPVRIPDLIPVDTPLSTSFAEAPPIVWSGAWKKSDVFQVEGAWEGLDATIKRFLDRIPFDPPTDH